MGISGFWIVWCLFYVIFAYICPSIGLDIGFIFTFPLSIDSVFRIVKSLNQFSMFSMWAKILPFIIPTGIPNDIKLSIVGSDRSKKLANSFLPVNILALFIYLTRPAGGNPVRPSAFLRAPVLVLVRPIFYQAPPGIQRPF